mgnify:CR=1 FL=1
MPTIDVHCHAFPDDVAPKAVTAISDAAPAGFSPAGDGTIAGLKDSMARNGIDISVVLPVATKPTQVATINRWAAEMHDPAAGVVFFGALHPAGAEWESAIEDIVTTGLPGVKMHAEFQQFRIDSPEMLPVYRAIADAGLVLLLHMGDELFAPCESRATPPMLARVLDAVYGLRVIAAHGGGFRAWNEFIDALAGHPRVWIDLAYLPGYIDAETFTRLLDAHGVTRVLLGSDYPWMAQETLREFVRAANLDPPVYDAVMGGNAAALLNLEPDTTEEKQ